MLNKYLALLVGAYLALSNTPQNDLTLDQTEWLSYKSQHNKVYESDEVESMRKIIFTQNKQKVEEFNSKHSKEAGFTLGLSHMSDVSAHEIKTIINGYKSKKIADDNTPEGDKFLSDILNDNSTILPDEVDWRKVPNRVTPVKDQGFCGSCWAFSTVGALEGQEIVRKANKSLGSDDTIVGLSEQNLVDCSHENHGCAGGQMYLAFDFIKKEGGIDDSKSYPYDLFRQKPKCMFKKDNVVMTDKGYALLPAGDEEALKKVVARFGPVSVAIDASSDLFQQYNSGIYNDPNCSAIKLDHGVLVVGYGTDPNGVDYWIVKNSWNTDWGDQGYIRMRRNKQNQCGIATAAVIPIF